MLLTFLKRSFIPSTTVKTCLDGGSVIQSIDGLVKSNFSHLNIYWFIQLVVMAKVVVIVTLIVAIVMVVIVLD